MVAMKLIICFSALLATALAAVTGRKTRQFLPSDLKGKYSQFVKQGICAQTVQFKDYTSEAPGVYSIPHDQILEDGTLCTGDGSLRVVTKDKILGSGYGHVLDMKPINAVVEALKNQGATFMLGYEKDGRTCGPAATPAKSVAIFVDEEKNIRIPGLITLFPGAKYIVVFDTSSPTPCTYFAKHEERVIGVAATPTPIPQVVTTPVPEHSEPYPTMEAEIPSGTEEAIQGTDSDGSADGGADATGAAATGAAATGAVAAGAVAAGSSTVDDGETAVDAVSGLEEEAQISPEGSDDEEEEGEDDGSACFPAHATVELEDGSFKTMDSIELGDRVKVASGEFSPVFMFTHKMAGISYSFVRLTASSGHSLELTKGHYLYVNGDLAAAESVHVGDSIETDAGVVSVSAVARVVSRGLYNPQTVNGNIVVNGVRASTYTTAVEIKTAHSLLLPLRAVFRLAGMTSAMLDNGSDKLASMLPSGGIIV
ncbi:Warthog protein 6 [Gracilariopsis chorda]|uniref:Warthog protein 6 n=1 Tax=Gracilariopsis chorda TaxID=448386 RepID=A0A2V3IGP9_9FLOR|nr:Warthog protein 6 [Gracilariopsis chorda]|eukprot:PXF41276.1 Warthog protein 6 [Gracilariopsis chorda]